MPSYILEMKDGSQYKISEIDGGLPYNPQVVLKHGRRNEKHVLDLIASYRRGRMRVEQPSRQVYPETSEQTTVPLTAITSDLRIYTNLGTPETRRGGYKRILKILTDIRSGKLRIASRELSDKLMDLNTDEFLDVKLALAMQDETIYRKITTSDSLPTEDS